MADLLSEFRRALAVIPSTHSCAGLLSLGAEIVERNQVFMQRHPTTLFQCFWNTGWWAGSDQRFSHLRSSERGVDYSPGVSDDPLPTGMLARVVDNWHRIKNDTSPGFRWIRSLRPPQQGLGSACRSEVRGQLKHTSSIGCSGDGSIVAWAGGGGSDEPKGAYVWLQKMGRLDFVSLRSAPFDVDVAADGSRIAFVFGETTTIYPIDADGRVASDFVEIVATDGDAFHRVCFSPNSDYVAMGLQSGHVQVTRVDDGKTLWSEVGHPGKFVRGLAWSGGTLVSGGDDAGVVAWNASNGAIRFRFANLAAEVSSVDVCDDYVAAGTGVDDFKLMDVMLEGQSINDYQLERSRVFLWDARTGREVTQMTGHREKVNSVRFVNGGTQVMSCSGGLLHGSEHSVFVWDTASGSLITNLGKQAAAVVGSCADTDRHAFFTVCWNGAVQAWDGARVLESRPIVSHEQEIRIIEFSPNGRRVVTTSWDDPPRIWDVDSGRHIATLTGHECLIRTASFSPDSRLILTGAGRKYPKEPMDYTARLWDVETGRCRGILEGHTSPVTLAKFSMDGKFIVTGESDVRSMVARPHTIRVWDVRTLKQIAKFGRGQPEFMISLVSGDNPEHLVGELERMGIHLPPPPDAHLVAEVTANTETRVHLVKKSHRSGEDSPPSGVTLGWVPDLPNSTITPFAVHSASLTIAIAHGHDLRLYRLESDSDS